MDTQELISQIGDCYQMVVEANRVLFRLWLDHVLFTWRWWLNFVLAVGSWVIWFRKRKKESADRLMYAGYVIIILSCWVDFIGVIFDRWYYMGKLIPTIPAYIEFDFCVLPVEYMLLIQWKPHLSPWVKAIAVALVNSYIAEPILAVLKIYVPVHWTYAYSVPFYVVFYLIASYLALGRKRFAPLR